MKLAADNGDGFEKGIQLVLQAVLVSPHFLFRVELDRGPGRAEATVPIDDWHPSENAPLPHSQRPVPIFGGIGIKR